MIVRKLPISYFAGILLGLAFSFLWAFQDYLYTVRIGQVYKWRYYLPVPIVNYVFWGMLLPVIYHFVDKYPVKRPIFSKANVWALLISFAIAFFHETITSILYHGWLHLTDLSPWNASKTRRILRGYPLALFYRFFEYCFIFTLLTAIDLQQRIKNKQQELAQVEKQLADAQIDAIRGQLQPHFLFNTLNSISSLMDFNVKSAQKVISKLGTLLRTVLEKNKSKMIPLQDELAFIINYLDIEQIRFQDRLEVRYDIDKTSTLVPVPNLILQPLVANAIQYGFAQTTGQGIIELHSKKQEENLELILRDNGQRSAATLQASEEGFQRVQNRLKALYQDRYGFAVQNLENGGMEIIIRLPNNPKLDL